MSIKCELCGKIIQKLTPAHLAHKHDGMTTKQYYEQFGQPKQIVVEPIPHPLDQSLEEPEKALLSPDQKNFVLKRAEGLNNSDAMEAIGHSVSLLYTTPWQKVRPVAEAVIARLAAEPLIKAQWKLVQGSEKAADRLVDLVDDTDPRVALHASDSVLDRVGIAKRPTVTLDLDFSHWTDEQLDRYISEALAKEQAIEAQYEELDDE